MRRALFAIVAACGAHASTPAHPSALHGTLLVEQFTGNEPPQLAALDLASGAVRQLDARGSFTVHRVAADRVVLTEAPHAFLVTAKTATSVQSIEQISPDGKRAFGQCEDGSFCIGIIRGSGLVDTKPVATHDGDVLLALAWVGDRVIATDFDKVVAIDANTYQLRDLGAIPQLARVAVSPSAQHIAWIEGERLAIGKLDDMAHAERFDLALDRDFSDCTFAGEQHLACISNTRAFVVDVATGKTVELGASAPGEPPVPSPDATAVIFPRPDGELVISPIDHADARRVASLKEVSPIAWLAN